MRRAVLLLLVLFGLTGAGFAAYGVEKTEFVAKCVSNGRDYEPCACTYNALPELPDAYADLAVVWAHEPPGTYRATYVKTVLLDMLPVKGGRKTAYGHAGSIEEKPSYFRKMVKSVGTSFVVKWAVNLLPGVDGGTSLVVTQATKATGKFGYARYVFDRHCGKRLQTVVSEVRRLTTAASDATKLSYQNFRTDVSDAMAKLKRQIGLGAKN